MIKALFFDFYGTIGIYDNIKLADKKTWNIILKYISDKVSVNYDEFLNKWNEIFSTTPCLEEIESESIFVDKLRCLFKFYNVKISNDELKTISEECLQFWHSHINLPINLHTTLASLKKRFKLAIVSNYDHPAFLRSILKDNGLLKYFDYIVISGEIGINKPDERIFKKALDELNLNPNEVLFIGDNIVDDIEGSSKVGCYPLLIDMAGNHDMYTGNKINKLYDLIDFNYTFVNK